MPFLGLSLKSLAGLAGEGKSEIKKKRDKERSLFRDSLEISEVTEAILDPNRATQPTQYGA